MAFWSSKSQAVMRKHCKISLLASMFAGALAGMAALGIGFAHNAQNEFFDDSGSIDILFAASLFISWFVIVTVVILAMSAIASLFFRRKK